jgi:hypothetical protein
MNALGWTLGLVLSAAPAPEVLCERTTFVCTQLGNRLATFNQLETTRDGGPSGMYGLSAVTVPPAGWDVHAVSIFTNASAPDKWVRLKRARLNVIPKTGDVPAADDDPRHGREVAVAVRDHGNGVFAVTATDLKLHLEPGDYWIGLTPIYDFATHGRAGHLLTDGVRNARFDDVARAPDGEGGAQPFLRDWMPLGPRIYAPINEHLAIKVEGTAVRRGRVIDWPPEKGPEARQLHLRFATFDPAAGSLAVEDGWAALPTGRLWIVQSRATVDQPFREALTRAGAMPLRYLPDDAYVVALDPLRVPAVRGLEPVRWVGPYHPAYRLDPNVLPPPFDRPDFGDHIPHNEPGGVRRVRVHLFERGADVKRAVAEAIRAAGGEVLYQSVHGFYLVANVPRDRLPVIARRDEVCAIERALEGFEPQQVGPGQLYGGSRARVTMAQVRELCGANFLRQAGGYEGLGVRVAFWDDGVRTDHIDFLARSPITFVGPRVRVNANHGTAIAGILCGDGRGDPSARGLLPVGSLVFASAQGGNEVKDGYDLIARFVHDHHAALMSDSSGGWGGLPFVTHYDGYAALLDDLVLEHDLLYCSALSNGSPGKGQAGSWAKNVLHVGGVHPQGSVRREDHRPLASTTGPAADGRVKPDLVHFGFGVYTASAAGPREYENFAGTSCATPVAAGHCGLMIEAWADGAFGTRPLGKTVTDRKPHAATAKALMVNSAFRYPIGRDPGQFTRYQQGWGMPDLRRLYESREKMFVIDQELALRDRQAVEYRLRVDEKEPELRATLAYTDPLGLTTAAKVLVNDLDLIVIAPGGKHYYGNVGLLDGNVSESSGDADRVNNVENVFVRDPEPGAWRVIVAAHRIAGGRQVPTAVMDQDFGLVVCGVRPQPELADAPRK